MPIGYNADDFFAELFGRRRGTMVLWALKGLLWAGLSTLWGVLFHGFAVMVIPQAGPRAWTTIGILAGLLFAGWVAGGRR